MCVISLLSLILNVPNVTKRITRRHLKKFIMVLIYLPLCVGVGRLLNMAYDWIAGVDPRDQEGDP